MAVKLCLLGYGKMGKMIAALAPELESQLFQL